MTGHGSADKSKQIDREKDYFKSRMYLVYLFKNVWSWNIE